MLFRSAAPGRPSLASPVLAVLLTLVGVALVSASDWPRFRGPNGTGVSTDEKAPPTEWSDTKNLKWKVPLPGPGLSSPIIVGDKVFVTCWSGYGASRGSLGDQKDLKRHLVCVDRKSGKVLWDKSVAAVLPEEPFRGMFAENGYASHTPACDGERVFAFYGKTGVYAYDMEGKELWHKGVGTKDDPRSWGTASSPILYKDLVIIPATVESQAMIALNKKDGSEAWRNEAKGFASCWSTPVLVDLPGGEQELAMGVAYEIWGFNPATGKLRWFCEFNDADSMCSSVVAQDGVIYAIEGRSGGSIAVKAGGKDDAKKNIVWSGSERGRIGTPVLYDGLLYTVNGGVANCIDAKTGEKVYQSRLGSGGGAGGLANNDPPAPGPGGRPGGGGGRPGGGFGGPGGGFGGGGGRGGGQDYSSPVIAGGKLYYITRGGESYVLETGRKFKLVATNRFESDKTNYSATPAIANGDLFIRSNTHLYCVGTP